MAALEGHWRAHLRSAWVFLMRFISLRQRRERLRTEALAAIAAGGTAEEVLDRLTADADYCRVCCYKRKRPTGEPIPVSELVDLDDITAHLDEPALRRTHVTRVIDALVNGDLTDVELAEQTSLYLDSAKACRANLMAGGWVEASGDKRMSPRNRPMTVWQLTDAARQALGV